MGKIAPVLEWILRLTLGGLFIYASFDKIIDPQAFARVIVNYQILPEWMVNPLALWLPWIELVGGICLITGWQKLGGLLVIALLLLVFTGALGYNLYRGVDINCGCFSNDGDTSHLFRDIIRDIILLTMAVGLFLRSASRRPKRNLI